MYHQFGLGSWMRLCLLALSMSVLASVPAFSEAHASGDPFVTTWRTTTANETVTIHAYAVGSHTIDWGDGTRPTTSWWDQAHVYGQPGNYTVSITGDFTQIRLDDDWDNAKKLASIDSWGDVQWATMGHAFAAASNMVYGATDVPDLSSVTDLQYMFYHAASFNGNLSGWDVSSVTNMKDTFAHAASFNGDISGWDVSKVQNMHGTFFNAASFNGDISGWDVSSVTDMVGLFAMADSFNADISGWNVSSVTDMNTMFFDADSFNADISDWDVSSVTDMNNMFYGATSFNADISDWDVSSVADMTDMFALAGSFDQNLGPWYVVLDNSDIDYDDAPGSVGSISAQNPFLDGQDVAYSIGAGGDSGSFELDGTDLRLKEVPTKRSYTVTINATGDFGSGNSRSVAVAVLNFPNAPPTVEAGPNQTVREGATVTLSGNATDADGDHLTYVWTHDSDLPVVLANDASPFTTFEAPAVDQDATIMFTLSADDGANPPVTDRVEVTVTDNAPPTVEAGPNQTVREGATVTLSGNATDADGDHLTYVWTHDSDLPVVLANDASPFTTFEAPAVDRDTAVTFTLTVSDGGGADVLDTVSVTVLEASDFVTTWTTTGPGQSITIPARGTYDVDWGDGTVEKRVTGSQTHTYDAAGDHAVRISDGITRFHLNGHAGAGKLASVDQWGHAQWTTMYQAFRGASNMEYNATDVPDLSRVTDAGRMFEGASSFDGDLSAWDVSNVKRMSYMFKEAGAFDSDLSAWDVSGATDMSGMFWKARAFDSDLSAWDVSGVTDMYAMFYHAKSFDSDLSAWNVSRVTGMANMFSHARAFDSDLSAWDVSGVTTMYAMFAGTKSFDSNLSAWNVSSVTDMADMFRSTKSFDGDISGWAISEDVRLAAMLYRADAFERNLGEWYVVLQDASIRPGDVPGIVGYVTALNPYLDGQDPSYGIGTGGDSGHFEMDHNALRMVSAPDGGRPYTVNITSAGGWGTGNSHTLEITVSDSAEPAPAGPREVASVTISSTQPGTIHVEWGAPADFAKDYRIAWTKSGEPFKTFRNLDWNAFPTDPQYTIADLEEGQEYEVKVRARYAGSPNGPWSDVFAITVAGSN